MCFASHSSWCRTFAIVSPSFSVVPADAVAVAQQHQMNMEKSDTVDQVRDKSIERRVVTVLATEGIQLICAASISSEYLQ